MVVESCKVLLCADTNIASIMKQLNEKQPLTAFQRGIRFVTWMMLGFMVTMVLVVSFTILVGATSVFNCEYRSFSSKDYAPEDGSSP